MSLLDRAEEKGSRGPKARPLAERFAEKVKPATDLSPNGMSGCLLWTAAVAEGGYGVIWDGCSRTIYAHTAARLLVGLPPCNQTDHLCRRRHCVNVDHMEDVTSAVNVRRGAKAKLTMEAAADIRYLRAAGWNTATIASAYGVSRDTIYGVTNRKTWT